MPSQRSHQISYLSFTSFHPMHVCCSHVQVVPMLLDPIASPPSNYINASSQASNFWFTSFSYLSTFTLYVLYMVSCLAVFTLHLLHLRYALIACVSTETETTNSPVFIDLPSAPHCLLINHKLSTIFLPPSNSSIPLYIYEFE
jgi:hypothetical protein